MGKLTIRKSRCQELTSPTTSGNEEAQEVVKASWVSVRLEGLEPPTF